MWKMFIHKNTGNWYKVSVTREGRPKLTSNWFRINTEIDVVAAQLGFIENLFETGMADELITVTMWSPIGYRPLGPVTIMDLQRDLLEVMYS